MSEPTSDLDALEALASEGETCQFCGTFYATVYRVPDDVWAKIREDVNLLCFDCADHQARNAGIALYWSASLDDYPDAELRCLQDENTDAANTLDEIDNVLCNTEGDGEDYHVTVLQKVSALIADWRSAVGQSGEGDGR